MIRADSAQRGSSSPKQPLLLNKRKRLLPRPARLLRKIGRSRTLAAMSRAQSSTPPQANFSASSTPKSYVSFRRHHLETARCGAFATLTAMRKTSMQGN